MSFLTALQHFIKKPILNMTLSMNEARLHKVMSDQQFHHIKNQTHLLILAHVRECQRECRIDPDTAACQCNETRIQNNSDDITTGECFMDLRFTGTGATVAPVNVSKKLYLFELMGRYDHPLAHDEDLKHAYISYTSHFVRQQ
mgnify:CR=1 FL=1